MVPLMWDHPSFSFSPSCFEDNDLFAGVTLDNPATYHEAMASPHAAEWMDALQEEFMSLKELGVYCLIPQTSVPTGYRIICRHPIFCLKQDKHSNPLHFKAQYVCKRYSAVYTTVEKLSDGNGKLIRGVEMPWVICDT